MPVQPAGYSSVVQPESPPWRDFFPSLSFEPHPGQRETYEVAAEENPAEDKLIVLPTGYGKTRAAAGYYAISRELGYVDRCLWVVSSDLQRRGLSPKPDPQTGERAPTVSDRITEWFGLPCRETVTISGAAREIKMHWHGHAEIFVTSYQFLRDQATYFAELLESGKWLLVPDEAHHLREGGSWAAWLERLPRVGSLYMSATPLRTDRLPLQNVPRSPDGETFEARVHVTVNQAIDQEAVRQPLAHAQEWELEFADNAGRLVTYTTSQLRDLDIKDGDDVDAWVIKHDLKYTMEHLQRIVLDAVNKLNEKRATLPGLPAQMIVFAMSCKHAQFLASHVFPSVGFPRITGCDWIGVTRSAVENEEVVNKFLGGQLPILVQVDKAGEGFDHPPASVALFLNMITSPTKLIQQLGRVMRRDFEVPFEKDVAPIFADTSHPVVELVRSMEPDDDRYRKRGEGGGGEGPNEWPPLPTLVDIKALWLRTDVFGPDGSLQQQVALSGMQIAAHRYGMTTQDVQEIVRLAVGQVIQPAPPAPMGEVGHRALMEARVDSTMSLIVTHAIRLASNNGVMNPKQLAGLVKKNLNFRWKRDARMGHNEMLSADFEKKYEWLREIDEGMRLTREVPPWLINEPRW